MGRSELLGPEVRTWLSTLRVPLRTPAHEIAVAMMRSGFVTNVALCEWGVERHVAGSVLRDLTDNGIVIRQGGRRYARYVLDPAAVEDPAGGHGPVPVDLESALREVGTASAAELQRRTGLSRATVNNKLQELAATGLVRVHGARQSPKRTYEWTGTETDAT